jgi:hypothetical protein
LAAHGTNTPSLFNAALSALSSALDSLRVFPLYTTVSVLASWSHADGSDGVTSDLKGLGLTAAFSKIPPLSRSSPSLAEAGRPGPRKEDCRRALDDSVDQPFVPGRSPCRHSLNVREQTATFAEMNETYRFTWAWESAKVMVIRLF